MFKTIVIATPHPRNLELISKVAQALQDFRIVHVSKKEDLTHEKLTHLDPSWVFFPHWSWIISPKIFQNFRCVIFHMTDLPYGRGGSPLQNLIVKGHKHTQLTALKCVEELDAGPIYAKRPLSLDGNAEDILKRASSLFLELIIWIVENEPAPTEQEGTVVKFVRRKPNEGNISNLVELNKVYDYIRMLDAEGYPPAHLVTENLYLEFSKAQMQDDCIVAQVCIRIRNDC